MRMCPLLTWTHPGGIWLRIVSIDGCQKTRCIDVSAENRTKQGDVVGSARIHGRVPRDLCAGHGPAAHPFRPAGFSPRKHPNVKAIRTRREEGRQITPSRGAIPQNRRGATLLKGSVPGIAFKLAVEHYLPNTSTDTFHQYLSAKVRSITAVTIGRDHVLASRAWGNTQVSVRGSVPDSGSALSSQPLLAKVALPTSRMSDDELKVSRTEYSCDHWTRVAHRRGISLERGTRCPQPPVTRIIHPG